jgi:hypothetical protein
MRLVIGFALLPLLTGCLMGSAKVWSQDTTGGVLALDGDEGKAMEDADKKMAAHCGLGNYQLVKRETVVVGQEQYSNTNYGEQQNQQAQTTTAGASSSQYGYGETANVQGGSSTVVTPNQTSTRVRPAPTCRAAATSSRRGCSRRSSRRRPTSRAAPRRSRGRAR